MRRFYDLTTMKKLLLGFAAVCVIVGGMGWIGVRGTLSLKENLRIVYADYTVAASDLGKISGDILRCRQAVLSSLDARDPRQIADAEAKRAEFKHRIITSLDAYAATTLRVSATGRDEKKDLTAFRAAVDAYVGTADATMALLARAAEATDPAEAGTLREQARTLAFGDSAKQLDGAVDAYKELLATVTEVAKDMNDAGEATAAQSYWTMIGGTAFAVLTSIAVGYFLARVISRPLVRAVGVLESVAAGDFTARLDVDTKDEVGRMATALNAAVESVRTALTDVRSVADSVAGASTQLSSASEEISSGAQEQAASLEETASSLEEITGTVKQNAECAQQASQLAAGARDAAERGGQVVAETVRAMAEINESSKKIGAIITTIDEIAFQTNLLALNAAVEAARAGEQGRGFAVVAGEVRSLAQRSAGAAKEIKELIGDSVRKVEAGSELVGRSGKTLEEIIVGVKRTTDVVGEIAAASQEQANGVDQVSRAVAQMDTVTQANAGQTEELSGTAEALAGQARQLQELVGRFRLGKDASTTAAPMPAPAAKTKPAAKPAARKAGNKGHAANGHAGPKSNGYANGRKRDAFAAEHELDLVGALAGNRFSGEVEEF